MNEFEIANIILKYKKMNKQEIGRKIGYKGRSTIDRVFTYEDIFYKRYDDIEPFFGDELYDIKLAKKRLATINKLKGFDPTVIKQAREIAGLSSIEAAGELGITTEYLWKIEHKQIGLIPKDIDMIRHFYLKFKIDIFAEEIIMFDKPLKKITEIKSLPVLRFVKKNGSWDIIHTNADREVLI